MFVFLYRTTRSIHSRSRVQKPFLPHCIVSGSRTASNYPVNRYDFLPRSHRSPHQQQSPLSKGKLLNLTLLRWPWAPNPGHRLFYHPYWMNTPHHDTSIWTSTAHSQLRIALGFASNLFSNSPRAPGCFHHAPKPGMDIPAKRISTPVLPDRTTTSVKRRMSGSTSCRRPLVH